MAILRTPEDRFQSLPGFPFAPHYVEVNDVRIHYVDEGAGEPVLMLHGEPSWCYLYRKMIPPIARRYRAIAMDFAGFGRSDKFTDIGDYSYQMHVDTLASFVDQLDLRNLTLVMQDWGGLIGLRFAADHPDRVARMVAMNTFLPTGDQPPGEAFLNWQRFATTAPELPIGQIIQRGTVTDLPPEVVAAYDAPFPDERYKAGARAWPALVPTRPDQPGAAENRRAWQVLERWTKPVLVAFSDSDPVTRGADRLLRERIPGTQGEAPITIAGAGHFLQEDKGEEIAAHILEFLDRRPL